MLSHHREIKDFLVDRGATAIHIEWGGKHPKVAFDHKGRHFAVPVSISPSDYNASKQAKRELQKLIGEDTGPEDNRPPPRKLEDMLPAAPEQPRYIGSMAMYPNPNFTEERPYRLRFIFPQSLYQTLQLDRQVIRPSRLDAETWSLKPCGLDPSPKVAHARKDGNQYVFDTAEPAIIQGYTPFGTTPVEYIVVADDIVVHLDSKSLHPLIIKRRPASLSDKTEPEPEPEEDPTTPEPVVPEPVTLEPVVPGPPPVVPPPPSEPAALSPKGGEIVPLDQYMRQILRMIVAVEKISAHKLTHVRKDNNEHWEWRAPVIRLED